MVENRIKTTKDKDSSAREPWLLSCLVAIRGRALRQKQSYAVTRAIEITYLMGVLQKVRPICAPDVPTPVYRIRGSLTRMRCNRVRL